MVSLLETLRAGIATLPGKIDWAKLLEMLLPLILMLLEMFLKAPLSVRAALISGAKKIDWKALLEKLLPLILLFLQMFLEPGPEPPTPPNPPGPVV